MFTDEEGIVRCLERSALLSSRAFDVCCCERALLEYCNRGCGTLGCGLT